MVMSRRGYCSEYLQLPFVTENIGFFPWVASEWRTVVVSCTTRLSSSISTSREQRNVASDVLATLGIFTDWTVSDCLPSNTSKRERGEMRARAETKIFSTATNKTKTKYVLCSDSWLRGGWLFMVNFTAATGEDTKCQVPEKLHHQLKPLSLSASINTTFTFYIS